MVAYGEICEVENVRMSRSNLLRPLPLAPINVEAHRRRALSLRGRCRRHNIGYPLNILHQGVVIAAGCPMCHPQFAR